MELLELELKEIKPYENNPRINEDAVEFVANSIKEFGFKQPIVLDKNYFIIVGHTRFLASQRLKLKKVPCLIASDLTDDQVRAYRLADNKVAEFSEFDYEKLELEFDQIELNMEKFGFIEFDDTEILEEAEEEIFNNGGEKDTFDITFKMPVEHKEEITNKIKSIGKDEVTQKIQDLLLNL